MPTPFTLFNWSHPLLLRMQQTWGDKNLKPVPGAGCIKHPKIMLLFINPTARNITTLPSWNYNTYPWIGTKQVWKFLYESNLISGETLAITQNTPKDKYTPAIVKRIYADIAAHKIFIAEFIKATKKDSAPLPDAAFKHALPFLLKEIKILQPKYIIALGSKTATHLLGKQTLLKNDFGKQINLQLNKKYKVIISYYPVGQGARYKNEVVRLIRRLNSN